MNAKKSLLIVFLFLSLSVSAEVEFSGLDITPANNLLFLASTDLPGFGSYETLFLAGLKEKKLKQLTFFPEKISFLKESKQLQIQNRYGVFRSDSRLQNIAPIDLFPSFVKGREIATGKITPIHASPDGKYLVFIRQKSAAYGDLILYDHIKSIETVVSEKVECSLTDPAALWSPDSKTFAYSTGGNIYYFSIHQYEQKTVMSEEYRKVNEGTIKSAQWGNDSNLYYIAGTLVYRIGSREFFTKSLYSGLLKAGEIAGKIPFPFNPNFDSFLISPDGKKILLNKEGRNLFLYYLNPADFAATGSPTSLPYLFLPRNAVVKQVLWSSGDSVTLLASGIVKGESISSLFRLDVDDEFPPSAFKKLEETGIQSLYLSPGEKTVALLKKDRVLIYDYVSWVKTDEMRFSQPLSAIWRSDSELLIAGKYTIKLYNTSINSSKLIALSQPGEYGYTKDSRFIQVRVDDGNYQREPESAGWESTNTFSVRDREVASQAYRVFLEISARGSYRNIIMVRNIMGYGTESLLAAEEIEYEHFPAAEEPVNFQNFNHGSRIRRREVALVFNAAQSIEGLTAILNTLHDYGLKCSFFINGEAIRRYPGAIKEIAESGHEIGSLFYTYFNMTDSNFNIDKSFIKQGLARLEDDYYTATSREVSLLWHAPYYFVNSEIIDASIEMNYTHVGRDVDSMDWVNANVYEIDSGMYQRASGLIERILEKKKPGSIIPILIGIPEGAREDYLFQKLDLLINGLYRQGYSIVPISTLIENAR